MTPDELKQTVDNVVNEVNGAAELLGVLDPELLPFIAIGKAVDKQIPGLVEAVDGWIRGNPPTDKEKADLLSQLKVLGNPDLP